MIALNCAAKHLGYQLRPWEFAALYFRCCISRPARDMRVRDEYSSVITRISCHNEQYMSMLRAENRARLIAIASASARGN